MNTRLSLFKWGFGRLAVFVLVPCVGVSAAAPPAALKDAFQGFFIVTFRGITGRDSWRRFGTPLLFDEAGIPKPAFDAVIAEARETAGAKLKSRADQPAPRTDRNSQVAQEQLLDVFSA